MMLENIDYYKERLDAIDARLEKLENRPLPSPTYGPIMQPMSGVQEAWKELINEKPQEYITMSEHIENRPEGMTEDEAMQDFIERALANIDTLEFDAYGARNWKKWAAGVPSFQLSISNRYRLPLDADDELPDYPLLRCPDVDLQPSAIKQNEGLFLVAIYTGYGWFHRNQFFTTVQAARAMWNKWMRERFGVKYGEVE